MRAGLLLAFLMQTITCLTTENSMTQPLEPTSSSLSTPLTTLKSKPPLGSKSVKEPLKTDAPMLNYIFDTHSGKGKHHHHDYKWGPHFDEAYDHLNGTTVSAQIGDTALLNCRVIYLQDKTVSWVRRRDSDDIELLTVATHRYSGDDRYTAMFQYPGNWRLQIKLVKKRDEGLYECQISTHPPKVYQTYVYVNAPEVVIVDEHGLQLSDKYYESASTIQLSCIVRHKAMTSSAVHWLHGNRTLNYDVTRGGISVKTELMDEGANSTLAVARVSGADSGNYTCYVSPTEFATVSVHVLNESLAELHHGSRSGLTCYLRRILILLGLVVTSGLR